MDTLPPCGLYKTTVPLKFTATQIDAGSLVYFHNHSDQNVPVLVTPKENRHNRWMFEKNEIPLKNPKIIQSLIPLKAEGLYRLGEHIHVGETQIVNQGALVQLGYNPKGEPLIFFPRVLTEINGVLFPDKGMKIDEKTYDLLDPLDLKGPFEPEKRHVH